MNILNRLARRGCPSAEFVVPKRVIKSMWQSIFMAKVRAADLMNFKNIHQSRQWVHLQSTNGCAVDKLIINDYVESLAHEWMRYIGKNLLFFDDITKWCQRRDVHLLGGIY